MAVDVDDSWMLAFLDDLGEIARQRGLNELARDLDRLIARHSGLAAEQRRELRPCASGERGSAPILPFRQPDRDG